MHNENDIEIPGAVRVKKRPDGTVAITLLADPNKRWVGREGATVPAGSGFTVGGTPGIKNYMVGAYAGVFTEGDAVAVDGHYYANGNNRLSIAESTTRACERVYHETWGDYARRYNSSYALKTADERGSKTDLAKIVRKVILNGHGRDEVYRLAGRAKNLKESGGFPRYTLVELFQLSALLDGKLKAPVVETKS